MIGISSISLSYFRVHKRLIPLALLTLGFIIVISGHIFVTGHIEGIIVPLGGLTIALAHFVNYKCVGACRNCGHEGHFVEAEK
jgi:hypothetical protein